MKTFIINLDKDTYKKIIIEDLCKKHALDYEFITAIYGFQLKDDYIHSITNKQESITKIRRELSKGEIGCTLSHLQIFNKIINNNLEYALILEDDAYFDEKLLFFLNNFNGFLEDWDCILLGYYIGKDDLHYKIKFMDEIKSGNFIYRKSLDLLHGTHGYIVSKKGAEKLLKYNSKITLPIDSYTGNPKLINQFCVYPPIINVNKQLDINTELEKDRKRLREIYQITQNLIDKIDYFDKNCKIIIYGYGTIGQLLCEQIKNKKEIHCIIDSSYNLEELIEKHEDILFINTILTQSESIKITKKLQELFKNAQIISIYEEF